MIALHLGLVLLLTIENMVLQESCCKRYVFEFLCFCGFKVVLALLTKVVALYIQLTIVYIGIPRFERPIGIICKACWVVPSLLNIGFNKRSKEHIGWRWLKSKRRLRAWGCMAYNGTRSEAPDCRSSMTDKKHSRERRTESGE